MNDVEYRPYKAVKEIVEKAIDSLSGESRFDKLVELRDEAARLVNAERDNEKKRVAEARDKLKAELRAQQDRLRAVSVVTKPRGARKDNPKPHDGGGSSKAPVATTPLSGETDSRQGAGTSREIPPSTTPGHKESRSTTAGVTG